MNIRTTHQGSSSDHNRSIQKSTDTVVQGVDLSLYGIKESQEIEAIRQAVVRTSHIAGKDFFGEGILEKALRENNNDVELARGDITDFNTCFDKLKRVYPEKMGYTEVRHELMSGYQSLVNNYDLTIEDSVKVAILARIAVRRNREKLQKMSNSLKSKKTRGERISFAEKYDYMEKKEELKSASSVLLLLDEAIKDGEYNYNDLIYLQRVKSDYYADMKVIEQENAD